MNYTTNYNLNKPEGTDLYNHLTIDNPNMDTIDGAMHDNKLQAIGDATELVSGTVHAITRSDSDQNIFRFKATGNFNAGDTITVDGVTVNAYTTGGQPLLDDAYVLSAEVICVLDGTSLWVLANKNPDATDIPYDNNQNIKQKIDDNNTWHTTTMYPLTTGVDFSINLSDKDIDDCTEIGIVYTSAALIRYSQIYTPTFIGLGVLVDLTLANSRRYFKLQKTAARTVSISSVDTDNDTSTAIWIVYR